MRFSSTVYSEHSGPQATAKTSPSDYSGPDIDIRLYQYEVCPFCNKVRAYLDYHNIPYSVIEVDPLRKTELKQFSSDYQKVPIAVIDSEQVNGSATIIDHVHGKVHGQATPLSDSEQKWIAWLDDHLIHLVAPNIYRTPKESLQTFNYIADNAKFSAVQRATIRYVGALAMYFVGRKLKKKYNIENEREAIHNALRDWTAAIEHNGGKFFAGNEAPGISDLSIYGVLKALHTFDIFAELYENNAALRDWYDRTREAVGEPSVTERA